MASVGYTYSAPTYPIGITFDFPNLNNNIFNNNIPGYLYGDIRGPILTLGFQSALSGSNKTTLDNLVLNNAMAINTISDNPIANVFNAVVATTTGGILTSGFAANSVIDGYSITLNDIILIKNQSNPVENGLYQVNLSGAPSRSGIIVNANSGNSLVYINRGTINSGTQWICTNTFGQDIAGQSGLNFRKINTARVISACSQGPQGTQTVTRNNNEIIYRIPYNGSIRDGPITSASVISRIVTPGAGATYSIRLQTSGLANIGTTATLTTNAWQTNAIQITNPAAIPTTSDILAFVVTLTVSNVRTQYAEIVLGV